MIGRVVGLCLVLAVSAQAQPRVVLTDVGPGPSGRLIQAALAQPHRLVPPDTGWFRLRRAEHERATLVVLGRTAALEGNVDGDVIVVGGDLFIRPGARVGGRAIAIGGGVYPSALSVTEQGIQSFRDNTFVITTEGAGYRLAYQSLREHQPPPLLLPGVYGLRMPSYDRVNGASVRYGPSFAFAGGRGLVDLLATYRSDLGKFDPSVEGDLQLSRRLRAEFMGARGTFTNDDWIWSNLVNSFASLGSGTDTRNYYRADRARITLHRLWETTRVQVEPFAGALTERAWTVGPAVGEARGPWSVFGRTDSLGMRRPNPAIDEGGITSLLLGGRAQWESDELRIRARSSAEMSTSAPGDRKFVQVTSDLDVTFPTIREQEYALDVHWVTTGGDTPPAQRFVYMGGSGTLPFLDLLEQGGDEALLIDQRYAIPVPSIRVGLLGEPTFILRHRLGSAGLATLPDLEQTIGAGVILALLRVEVQFDPARRKTRLSAGFSFSR